jgi:hypothetical protein
VRGSAAARTRTRPKGARRQFRGLEGSERKPAGDILRWLPHNGGGALFEIDAVPKQSKEFALAHPERRRHDNEHPGLPSAISISRFAP